MSELIQNKEVLNSPIIVIDDNTKNNTIDIKNTNIYTYLLSFIVVCLVIYLIYYSYTCFYDNQYINTNIEKPIKSSDDDNCDDVFNVDKEVNKLIDLQDKYLSKIGSNK